MLKKAVEKWTSWKRNYMVRRERKLRLTMPMAATDLDDKHGAQIQLSSEVREVSIDETRRFDETLH